MEENKTKIKQLNQRQQWLYETIFGTETRAGKTFDVILIVVIIASVASALFESYIETDWMKNTMTVLEWFFTIFFTLEYVLRIYCSPHPRKYVLSFFGIIDLLSILPVYLDLLPQVWFPIETHYFLILRSFRLIRVFRVFKLFSFLNEGNLLMRSIAKSFNKIMVFFLFVLILNICIGTIMFVVEGDENLDINSIPQGIYWSIVTMTTVGFGDVVPVTTVGRCIASFVMLFGYTIIAVPTGIVSASMATESIREKEKRNKKKGHRKCYRCGYVETDPNAKYCRQCGAELDDENVVSMYR